MADSRSALKQALDHLKLPGVDWIGLREVREATTERYVRDSRPQSNDTSITHGVMVEVLTQGQFGYAATGNTDPESLVEAAKRAERQASLAARHAVHRFTAAQRPKVTASYAS